MKAIALSVALALVGSVGHAQILNPNSTEARLRQVERQVNRLEQRNLQLETRVRQIEDYLYSNPPPPPNAGLNVCTVLNKWTNKMFVGKSTSRIEAESLARSACVNAGSGNDCQMPKCDQEDYVEHTCRTTNTWTNKDFLGRANSVLEAQALSHNACVNAGSGRDCKATGCD